MQTTSCNPADSGCYETVVTTKREGPVNFGKNEVVVDGFSQQPGAQPGHTGHRPLTASMLAPGLKAPCNPGASMQTHVGPGEISVATMAAQCALDLATTRQEQSTATPKSCAEYHRVQAVAARCESLLASASPDGPTKGYVAVAACSQQVGDTLIAMGEAPLGNAFLDMCSLTLDDITTPEGAKRTVSRTSTFMAGILQGATGLPSQAMAGFENEFALGEMLGQLLGLAGDAAILAKDAAILEGGAVAGAASGGVLLPVVLPAAVAAAAEGTLAAADIGRRFVMMSKLLDDNRARLGQYKPSPKKLEAFPDAEGVKPKTKMRGGKLRPRWKDGSGRIYEWDHQHGNVEKYNKRGKHLGEFDPKTGEQTKPADPTRNITP